MREEPCHDAETSDVARIAHEQRQRGRIIAFTNGCFDLLHIGHIRYLERARALADFLIVGVNGDDSVRRLKGAQRPLVGQQERLSIVAALRCVDHAVLFHDDTPRRLIESIRPDVLVKGGDYRGTMIVGQDFVERHGGRIELVDLVEGQSTTNLLARIVERMR